MVDEKGAVITTVAVVLGTVFAGIVGYKILKKKRVFPRIKEKCTATIRDMKQSFRNGYRGANNPGTA